MRAAARVLLVIPLAASTAIAATPAPPPAHAFVGPSKCALCHKAAARGNQHGLWLKSKHAGAFATLGGDAARAIAKERGIADPAAAPECLRCHTAGPGANAADGVSCEACHGPGGDYSTISIMQDRARAQAAGLVLAGEPGCLACHNAESPTFKGFDYAAAFAAIAHPVPPGSRP